MADTKIAYKIFGYKLSSSGMRHNTFLRDKIMSLLVTLFLQSQTEELFYLQKRVIKYSTGNIRRFIEVTEEKYVLY
jgi:hypothetical protein